jgi:hypothetical protein
MALVEMSVVSSATGRCWRSSVASLRSWWRPSSGSRATLHTWLTRYAQHGPAGTVPKVLMVFGSIPATQDSSGTTRTEIIYLPGAVPRCVDQQLPASRRSFKSFWLWEAPPSRVLHR